MIHTLTSAVLLADDFTVTPTAPPGSEGVMTILGWIAWCVAALCFASFLVCAGWLAYAAKEGQEVRAAKGLVIAIIASVIAGAATSIFAVFNT